MCNRFPVTSRDSLHREASVLIVDDENENIELLVRTFRVGFRVWVAHSAEEAQEILSDRAIDVVVTDQRLPGMDGTALLEHVRVTHTTTRRILLTAYGDNPNVVEACERGVVERFFLKPFAPLALKGAVLELLRRPDAAHAPTALLATSDANLLEQAREVLSTRGIRTIAAANTAAAIALLKGGGIEVAVVSSNLDGGDLISLLRTARLGDLNVPVIVLTDDDYRTGLSLMEAGAFDFTSRPIRPPELSMRVERALQFMQQDHEHKRLLAEVAEGGHRQRVVARSETMQRVLATARKVARHDINALLFGETGTGKEVFAHVIHEASRRAAGPFVAVNCGALPEQLVDSALFGHERGAFTDARERRIGLFESADSGTLFLDEIGELSMTAQVRLLRALETSEITRVGGSEPVRVDVRVVAATNRDLKTSLREDLFFRLSAVTIMLPPLRERRDDIPALLEHAVAAFAARNAIPVPRVTTTAIQAAMSYPWPGNVRELLHVVERTLIKMGTDALDVLDFEETAAGKRAPNHIDAGLPLREALDPLICDLERRYLTAALARFDGHLGRTAEHAGIHRKSLYNKLRKYGMTADGDPQQSS